MALVSTYGGLQNAAEKELYLAHAKMSLLRKVLSSFEEAALRYVVIHGYQGYPDEVQSDVDLAIHREDIDDLFACLERGSQCGTWSVLHLWRHEIGAYACFLDVPDSNEKPLLLDICEDYLAERRVIIPWRFFFEGRVRFRDFWVPKASVEFTYLLCKGLVKMKEWESIESRLHELWHQDIPGAQATLQALGWTRGQTESLGELAIFYQKATVDLLGRAYSVWENLQEAGRMMRRVCFPLKTEIKIGAEDFCQFRLLAEELSLNLQGWFIKVSIAHLPSKSVISFREKVASHSRVECCLVFEESGKEEVSRRKENRKRVELARGKAISRSRKALQFPRVFL